MSLVDAAEAQPRFLEILDRVERGERVTITRQGKVVAELVPVRFPESTPEERERLMRAFWARPNRPRLDGLATQELRDEGRR